MGINRLFFALSAFLALVLLAGGFLFYLPRHFYHTLIKRKAPPGTSCSDPVPGSAGVEAGGENWLDTRNREDVFIYSHDGLRLHAYYVASGTPTLFIHGEADDFVPFEMVLRLYEACASEKELYTVPGAAHAGAYDTDPAEYERRIRNFLDKYMES
jgi:pimeloyl-ACP methyl ester carboxylesterase